MELKDHPMRDDLCEDLIAEIFGRLPTKSLLRLRSLSKSWYSRISSPTFIRNHALRSMKTSPKFLVRLMILYTKKNRLIAYRLHSDLEARYTLKESDMNTNMKCHVIGSCNGIICLYGIFKGSPLITLWNPSIRRRLTVPEHPSERSCSVIGFGFDPITNDYKIVAMSDKEDVTTSFIYTMKTNCWTQIPSPTISPPFLVEPYACFVNGALHWVVNPGLDNIRRHCCILTFDLSSHVFGTIPLPKPSWIAHQLTTIKGSLAVISSDGYDDSWMWVRRREYNNVAYYWSLRFNLKRIADFKYYNPESGMRSKIVSYADDSYCVYMDMHVESLELLDKETCSTLPTYDHC